MKIVLVSGGFDPLHSGHIEYFKEAKKLGDILVVAINSDEWLIRKKGQSFMHVNERIAIIKNLKMVDYTILFNDDDDSSSSAIQYCLNSWPDAEIVFANGGDRNSINIPEMTILNIKRLSFVFGVGGEDKKNSSSWILQEWKAPKTQRVWGYYRVLHEVSGTKVKELTIMPGQSISLQRHINRHELWHVTAGKCRVEHGPLDAHTLSSIELVKHDQISIPQNNWHRLYNPFNEPCQIIEIQYGDKCIEEDIIRKDNT